MSPSAHIDTFARDHLPPRELWPEFLFELPELQFPPRLNCAADLLDRWVQAGQGDRRCVVAADGTAWSYGQLQAHANRIARVLVDDLGVVPGNRVLLRGANSPMLAACWFGVVKAGAIAVGSMPLLRARELTQIVEKAQVSHALCDARLAEELALTLPGCPSLKHVVHYGGDAPDRLEARAASKPPTFDAVDTAADDTCIIAFTSGTTGMPKGTMHFHRDVMAACACWPRHVLRPMADDLFIGSPPLAFTFGLGGLLLFPMSVGASTVLLEKATPDALGPAIERHRATVCFSSPTAYRAMAAMAPKHDLQLASQVRVGRRGAARGHAPAVEGGDGHRDDRRHRLDGAAAHLHLRRRGPCQAAAPPACPCPATAPAWSTSRAASCRATRSAGSR